MKLFLRKAIVFFVIFLITFIIFALALYASNKIALKRVDIDSTEIIIGDSHITCTLDDKLISKAKNVGRESESLHYSYYKLKSLLNSNSQIRRVYLGFGSHNISNYYDFIEYRLSAAYFFTFSGREQLNQIKLNSGEFLPYCSNITQYGIKNVLKIVLKNSYPNFIAGYNNHYEGGNGLLSEDVFINRIRSQYYIDDEIRDFSEVNVMALNKIIDLCNQKNVDLVFFNAPLHRVYRSKIPDKFIDRYDEIVEESKLKIIDFSDITLTDDCFMPDGDHVSQKGAEIVSKKFSDYIAIIE